MKRALVAAALGGILLVGTPTLALSAQRNDTRAEKGADKSGDKGKGEKADKDDRGERGERHGRDGRRGRHGHRHDRDGYYDYYYGYPGYGGGYYGDPYYYDRYGAGRDGDVWVRGMAFEPPETYIRPGGHVTWYFQDSAPHTVTADNKSFDSGERKGGEFRLGFGEPGSYSYHCAIHPDMRGTVVVG